jgi:hypothetical protein
MRLLIRVSSRSSCCEVCCNTSANETPCGSFPSGLISCGHGVRFAAITFGPECHMPTRRAIGSRPPGGLQRKAPRQRDAGRHSRGEMSEVQACHLERRTAYGQRLHLIAGCRLRGPECINPQERRLFAAQCLRGWSVRRTGTIGIVVPPVGPRSSFLLRDPVVVPPAGPSRRLPARIHRRDRRQPSRPSRSSTSPMAPSGAHRINAPSALDRHVWLASRTCRPADLAAHGTHCPP